MANIAFLGTGLLGTGMVEAMLRRGESVTVWNRTVSKARALEQAGATVASSIGSAVAAAARVHMTLSDDAVVDDVLTSIVPHLPATTVVIDHTTTSPDGTIARYARMKAACIAFVHAPVFMSPDMARASQGVMLSSAPAAVFREVEAALAPMTGELWDLGDDPGRAAAYKLFGNSMIFTVTGGLADVFAMARNLGIAAPDALTVFSKLAVGRILTARGEKMAKQDYSATFEMTMARKDLRLMIDAAGRESLTVLPALADKMDRAIAAGHGHEDMAAMARAARID